MSKQRHCLVFRSRVDAAISVGQKHDHFFKSIKELGLPWGLGDQGVPPVPEFVKNAPPVASLTQLVGNGESRTPVTYRFRRVLTVDGNSDDALQMDFDAEKVAWSELIETVMPKYIEAFGAYRAELFDEKWTERADATAGFATLDTKPGNARYAVQPIGVVSFYDAVLCNRAFDLAPADVAKRLEGKAERVRLQCGGVFIVGSSRALAFDEVQRVCGELTACVRRAIH